MKKLFVLIGVVALATGLLATSSMAQETKYAGEFLQIGAGARALGMGGAFVGLANDGTAAYWNPAGMGGLHKKEATLMMCPASLESAGVDANNELAGINVAQLGASYNYFGLVWKMGAMRVGGSMIQLKVDDILDTRGMDYADTNTNGQWDSGEKVYYGVFKDGSTTADNMSSDQETATILSFSQNFSPSFTVGANVKLLSQQIFEYSASGFGVDVGVMYRMNPGNPLMGEAGGSGLAIGFVARDVIGTTLNWTTDTSSTFHRDGVSLYETEWESEATPSASTIPLNMAGGASFTLRGMPGISALTFAADVGMIWDGMDISAGMEMWLVDMLALRFGVKQIAGATADLSVMSMSAGIGLKFVDMAEVNYAFTGLGFLDDNVLGGAHRISMAFRF